MHLIRRANAKRVLLTAGLVGGALTIGLGGAFSAFSDTVGTSPQSLSGGVLNLAVGPTNDLGLGASALVAGDTVAREVDLNSNAATVNGGSITLGFSANTSSLLNQDPTNGLQVSISECSQAWTRTTGTVPPVSYTCGGTQSAVTIGGQSSVSVASLVSAPATLGGLNALVANKTDYLVFTLTLPSTAPGNLALVPACSGSIGGTSLTEDLQGCASSLTYNFVVTQQAASAK